MTLLLSSPSNSFPKTSDKSKAVSKDENLAFITILEPPSHMINIVNQYKDRMFLRMCIKQVATMIYGFMLTCLLERLLFILKISPNNQNKMVSMGKSYEFLIETKYMVIIFVPKAMSYDYVESLQVNLMSRL